MKKKVLGAIYGLCLLFAVYYLATVLQRQPTPGPVWPAYGERQDALVDEILSLLPKPGATGDPVKETRVAELIQEASLESTISLLVRLGYLTENAESGVRIQVAEALAPLTSEHVALLARKLHKSRVRGAALVSIGELLATGTALSGGDRNLELYLAAYEVYGYKKTRNRVDVLNGVLQRAAPETTLRFLHEIQFFDDAGDVSPVVMASLSMSTVFIALDNLKRAEEPDLAAIDKMAIASIQPGNEASDLRAARMLAAMISGRVVGSPDLTERVIQRCDADVIDVFLRLSGYVFRVDGQTDYRPEVVAEIALDHRLLMAQKLEVSGYLSPLREHAIVDLGGE